MRFLGLVKILFETEWLILGAISVIKGACLGV